MNRKALGLFGLLIVASLALSACQQAAPTATEAATTEAPQEMAAVRLQLQWVAQSQFAGYYAALAEGYYEEESLDVTFLEGAPEITPQQVCANGGADICIAWTPKALQSHEQGADLVNISQVFQRSGTLSVAFAGSGIQSVEDLRGKRVGVWDFGNEHEVFAALRKFGIDPENPDDVTIKIQPFDMTLLLTNEIDAAEAMTYNEYAQVLEQVNPATGELYQPEDLVVINYNDVGTAMLQDALWATESWLGQEGNEDVAVRFLRASYKGWIFCRDNFDACVAHVLAAGPTLGESHMRWQLNEINKLIWPSPNGIGQMDKALYDQTVAVAIEGKVLTKEPDAGAYRTDLSAMALEGLEGDTKGTGFTPITVEVKPGGE
ncbi:MAG TPA: ABC transporter substrate-binding protein [Anaerolineae bacterium]|nr:ABC transporter substrate-binding protein [Anaerolineae bacterium]